jgi:hypothetical protein
MRKRVGGKFMSEQMNKVCVNLAQDFTDAEKAQARANIGAAAAADIPAAPVQSDWTEADSASLAYIQHKPVIPSATSDLTNDSGFITLSDVPTIYLDYGLYQDTVASARVDMLASKQVTFTNPQAATDSPGFFVPTFDTDFDVGKVLTATDQGYPAWEYPIYEVVYGTTTYQQIADAYTEHKIIYCKVSSSGSTRIALLSNANPGTSGSFEFTDYKSVNHNYTTQADEVNVYTCTNTPSNQWSTTNRYGTYNIKAGGNMSYAVSGNNLTLGLSQVRLRDAVHAGYTAPLTTTTYNWDIFGGNVELTVEVLAAPDNNHCSHVAVKLRNKNNQVMDVWGQAFSNIASSTDFYKHPCCWATNNNGTAIDMETLTGATSSVGVGVWLAADELTNIAGKLVFDVVYSKSGVAHAGRLQIIRGSFLFVSSEYDSEA